MAPFSLLYVTVYVINLLHSGTKRHLYIQSENTKILVIKYINQLDFNKYKVKVDFWTTLDKQLHDRLLTSVSKQFMINKKTTNS